MARTRAGRRLATVLFLDIVGSTALASEVGDARWRELLARFRGVVRAELKRAGGREQDTAGDGFFATFAEPAQALRAAAAIALAVQELGVDVRAGLHTGECEEIDGKLGGIAVHIGSRVMGLAGAAEVLTTRTFRELVAGSSATFEDRGTHELKGVDGSWQVFAVRSADRSLPAPLSPAESTARRALVLPRTKARRWRLVFVAAAAAIVATAVLVPLLALGGETKAAAPISLVRVDGRTARVTDVVREGAVSRGQWGNLWSVAGTLWQLVGRQSGTLVERNLRTGRVLQTLPLGSNVCTCRVAFGFGSVWLVRVRLLVGRSRSFVSRIDELSGRRLKTIPLSGHFGEGTIATGNGAVWVLEGDGTLLRIDPLTNRVTGRYQTGALETTTLIPLAGYNWICECIFNSVRRFDPRTGQARRFSIPVQAYLVGVDAADGRTLWLLDPRGGTLTPMDPSTGRTEPPLGLSGEPQQAVIAFGAIWAAAGRVVDRIDLQTRRKRTLAMPRGVWAGSIAADSANGTIWIGNSGSAPPRS